MIKSFGLDAAPDKKGLKEQAALTLLAEEKSRINKPDELFDLKTMKKKSKNYEK